MRLCRGVRKKGVFYFVYCWVGSADIRAIYTSWCRHVLTSRVEGRLRAGFRGDWEQGWGEIGAGSRGDWSRVEGRLEQGWGETGAGLRGNWSSKIIVHNNYKIKLSRLYLLQKNFVKNFLVCLLSLFGYSLGATPSFGSCPNVRGNLLFKLFIYYLNFLFNI